MITLVADEANNETDDTTPALPTAPAAKRQPTKSEEVVRLLSRKAGATTAELGETMKWQPHTVRAFLSGLRKKGTNLVREDRKDGTKAYRITKEAAEPKSAAA